MPAQQPAIDIAKACRMRSRTQTDKATARKSGLQNPSSETIADESEPEQSQNC